eukprot:gene7738-1387_t
MSEAGESPRNKRQAVTITRMDTTEFSHALEMPAGTGTKLEDIPKAKEQIREHPASDFVVVHSLIFGKPGLEKDRKRNMLQFAGLAKDSTDAVLNKL